ncbi:hypothetical protein BHE74_00052415, partial [Ensete ventricosum]
DPADINEDERRRRSSKACLPALLRSACPLRHADPLEEDEDDKRKRLSPRGLPPSDAKQASPPIERGDSWGPLENKKIKSLFPVGAAQEEIIFKMPRIKYCTVF